MAGRPPLARAQEVTHKKIPEQQEPMNTVGCELLSNTISHSIIGYSLKGNENDDSWQIGGTTFCFLEKKVYISWTKSIIPPILGGGMPHPNSKYYQRGGRNPETEING